MRVSSLRRVAGLPRVVSKSKCLIHTIPVGSVQFPSAEKATVFVRFLIENQRDLIA